MIHNNTSHRFRNIALAVVAATLPVLLAGACSTKYTSERDGKALGEALCDLKDAWEASQADKKAATQAQVGLEAAQRALAAAQAALDKARKERLANIQKALVSVPDECAVPAA